MSTTPTTVKLLQNVRFAAEKHVQRDREAVPESPPVTRDDAEAQNARQEDCQAVGLNPPDRVMVEAGCACAVEHSV